MVRLLASCAKQIGEESALRLGFAKYSRGAAASRKPTGTARRRYKRKPHIHREKVEGNSLSTGQRLFRFRLLARKFPFVPGPSAFA